MSFGHVCLGSRMGVVKRVQSMKTVRLLTVLFAVMGYVKANGDATRKADGKLPLINSEFYDYGNDDADYDDDDAQWGGSSFTEVQHLNKTTQHPFVQAAVEKLLKKRREHTERMRNYGKYDRNKTFEIIREIAAKHNNKHSNKSFVRVIGAIVGVLLVLPVCYKACKKRQQSVPVDVEETVPALAPDSSPQPLNTFPLVQTPYPQQESSDPAEQTAFQPQTAAHPPRVAP